MHISIFKAELDLKVHIFLSKRRKICNHHRAIWLINESKVFIIEAFDCFVF